METVFLDRGSLDRGDLDLQPLHDATTHLRCYPRTHPEAVQSRLQGAEAVIVNKVPLDAATLAALPALRLIAVAATGTNNVDLEAARSRGITVTNCRGYGTAAVAQHALALILNLFTRMPAAMAKVRAGAWSSSPHFCLIDPATRELSGKRLGIVGYGALGQCVAQLAEALGMEVWIAERPGAAKHRPGRRAFEEVLAEVDVLSLHCPLTEENRSLIDRQALRAMRDDALLINTARGGLVDEQALAVALRNEEIGGAGLDVLTQEPPPADHPLLAEDLPHCIVTPHSAWSAVEARQRIVQQLSEILKAAGAGKKPPNCVVVAETLQ
ncbi:MAG: D-2-hydroxyacid dehydrogenase [Halorhodospira sp.]